MKTSVCLAVVISVVVIQLVNAQDATSTNLPATTATPICEEVMCMVGCERVNGPNGCPTCYCPTNCTVVTCSDGFECEMVPSCVATRCTGARAICVPIKTTAAPTPCPVYKCAEGCIPTSGPDGCPTCVCNRTCKDINCTKDEECVLRQIFCPKWVPCFPIPTCVPRNDATSTNLPATTATPRPIFCKELMCIVGCERVKGSDGCPICVCQTNCTTVKCRDGYVCEMRPMPCLVGISPCPKRPLCIPKAMTTTPCPMIRCESGCVEVRGSNGCMTCSCRRTCRDVNCTKDEECDMIRQDGCQTPPCPHTPTCVPRPQTCPTKPPCQFYCSTGFKKNKNGCILCECYE